MSLSGPSQQFGWVGHGTYAPLNIPNIFKAAGINTRWIPEVNEIFEAGLTYPVAPAPVAYAQDKLRIEDPVQEAKPVQSYSAKAQPAPIKVKSVPAPVKTSEYESPAVAPAYEAPAPAPAPAYKASQSVSAPTYKSPAPVLSVKYKAPAPAPAYKAPVSAPTYEAPAPAPAYKAPTATSQAPKELPAQPPIYTSQISYKASKPISVVNTNKRPESYGSQSIDLYSSSSTKAVPFFKASTTNKPIPTYKPSTTYTSSTTQKPSTSFKPSTTYKPSTTPPSIYVNKYVSTAKPFFGSPTPSAKPFYGSPTPSIYKSSPGYFVQPSYKPSTFFRSTNKPFTAFIGSPKPASSVSETLSLKKIEASPKFIENKPSIKLEKEYQNDIKSSKEADDGEVFYIFYENEENPLVRSLP